MGVWGNVGLGGCVGLEGIGKEGANPDLTAAL